MNSGVAVVNKIIAENASVGFPGPAPLVAQKHPPAGATTQPTRHHVFCHRRLRNLESQLEQFAVDPRRTPEEIGPAHRFDQTDQLGVQRRPPRPALSFPPPPAPPKPLWMEFLIGTPFATPPGPPLKSRESSRHHSLQMHRINIGALRHSDADGHTGQKIKPVV